MPWCPPRGLWQPLKQRHSCAAAAGELTPESDVLITAGWAAGGAPYASLRDAFGRARGAGIHPATAAPFRNRELPRMADRATPGRQCRGFAAERARRRAERRK